MANDPWFYAQSAYPGGQPTRPLVCDFPNCRNSIVNRCNLCGRAMCVRHIQWIGIQGSDGFYLSSHYRCDICTVEVQLQTQRATQQAVLVLLFLLSSGAFVCGFFTLPVYGVGVLGIIVGAVLLIVGLKLASRIRQ